MRLKIKCNSNCYPSETFFYRSILFFSNHNLIPRGKKTQGGQGEMTFHDIGFCWQHKMVMDSTYQLIIQFSFYFKHILHDIKILITVSFTSCYCYKNECRNNIFSGNKLYSHYSFKKTITREKPQLFSHWQKTSLLKRSFADKLQSISVTFSTWLRKLTFVFVTPSTESLCS